MLTSMELFRQHSVSVLLERVQWFTGRTFYWFRFVKKAFDLTNMFIDIAVILLSKTYRIFPVKMQYSKINQSRTLQSVASFHHPIIIIIIIYFAMYNAHMPWLA
jgi:hypothetical protein